MRWNISYLFETDILDLPKLRNLGATDAWLRPRVPSCLVALQHAFSSSSRLLLHMEYHENSWHMRFTNIDCKCWYLHLEIPQLLCFFVVLMFPEGVVAHHGSCPKKGAVVRRDSYTVFWGCNPAATIVERHNLHLHQTRIRKQCFFKLFWQKWQSVRFERTGWALSRSWQQKKLNSCRRTSDQP